MPQVIIIQLIYSTKKHFSSIVESDTHERSIFVYNFMICFSIFAMPSFVSPLFQIMPSLYIQYSLTNIVLHLYFTCVLTIYYYIEYVTLVYYGTKVVTNFSYNLNLAHLIQYSYIYIKHSHCYDFHVGVLFSLKLVY